MVDVLKDASACLEGERNKVLTEPVTYERGSDSVVLNATRGRTVFEIDDGFGPVERWEAKDFLVLAVDLILNGVEELPERGDIIKDLQGLRIYVYEVMSPAQEPFFRFSDLWRETLRIHTKQVQIIPLALLGTPEGEFIGTPEGEAIIVI